MERLPGLHDDPVRTDTGDAVAQLQPLVDLGVTEFTVYFWDPDTLRRFVDEVVPAFR